jgi:hypothetical protein
MSRSAMSVDLRIAWPGMRRHREAHRPRERTGRSSEPPPALDPLVVHVSQIDRVREPLVGQFPDDNRGSQAAPTKPPDPTNRLSAPRPKLARVVCPVCNQEVTQRDEPVPGAMVPRDETGALVYARTRSVGTFHPGCWEAYLARHPDGIETTTCPVCHGHGTIVKPRRGDATDALVGCGRCSERGWVEATG